ncbi:tetratricopeptide repeat protein [Pedobacter sp. SD-b]|uniref:Tetratricopeptide repeat protein n=1 Tax=Pedobacter segetis TaxID=2793069 RepID=A0ABS1BNN2_9SPHI|nr:tetratricopeptide repeat protein [Pedobacter segetis]MBK0384372.1 tetratricopeptide repeat protein [Pedobacter segetis]
MLKSKQYILIASVGLLMVILYNLDIKGLVKPKDDRGMQTTATAAPEKISAVSYKSVSDVAKQSINASLASDIEKLEDKAKGASGAGLAAIQKQIAQKWDDLNQPAPAAFAYEAVAKLEPNYNNWIITGDRFTDGYQNFRDTTATAGLLNKAITAYNKALEINPNSLDAKTGLGVAYVTGTQNPMQGIQLLLGVVKEDPKNVKANMNLGMFSMKSGQFQKAVDRFKTVIDVKPTPEAWFYLGTSYENLGMKPEAILAYQKSKELAADPSLSEFVDRKIKELNN